MTNQAQQQLAKHVTPCSAALPSVAVAANPSADSGAQIFLSARDSGSETRPPRHRKILWTSVLFCTAAMATHASLWTPNARADDTEGTGGGGGANAPENVTVDNLHITTSLTFGTVATGVTTAPVLPALFIGTDSFAGATFATSSLAGDSATWEWLRRPLTPAAAQQRVLALNSTGRLSLYSPTGSADTSAAAAIILDTSNAADVHISVNGHRVVTESTLQENFPTLLTAAFSTNTSGNLSIGQNAAATGEYSTALGYSANAATAGATALGNSAYAGQNSISIGNQASSNNTAVSIGIQTTATASESLAIGAYSTAFANSSLALGRYAAAYGNNSLAFGANALTGNSDTSSNNYYDTGENAIAIGTNSHAIGYASLALGYYSSTQGSNSIAAGYNSYANYDATAIGSYARAYDYYTTSIGAYSNSYNSGTSIGYSSGASGYYSTANGYYAQAYGSSSTAVGYSSEARGNSAIAIGYESQAGDYYNSADYSLAIGHYASAMNSYSTAIGYYSSVWGYDSTAIGKYSSASGQYSTAIGTYAYSSYDYSTSIGYSTYAYGTSSTAIGHYSRAYGYEGTAIGYGSAADASAAVSIGKDNSITWESEKSVAIGSNLYLNSPRQIVLGSYNDPKPEFAFMLGNGVGGNWGYDSTGNWRELNRSNLFTISTTGKVQLYSAPDTSDSGDSSSSTNGQTAAAAPTIELNPDPADPHILIAGARVLTAGAGNLIFGQTNNLAIGQNATATGDHSTAIGYYGNATAASSLAFGNYTTTYGNNSIAIGNGAQTGDSYSSYSTADNSIAIGYNARATRDSSTAIGYYSSAYGYDSTVLGQYSYAYGDYSTAIGYSTSAYGTSSTVIGYYSHACGYEGTAIGYGNSSESSAAVSIGKDNYITWESEKSVAIGSNLYLNSPRQVAFGSYNDPKPEFAFMLGNGIGGNWGYDSTGNYRELGRSNLFTITTTGKAQFFNAPEDSFTTGVSSQNDPVIEINPDSADPHILISGARVLTEENVEELLPYAAFGGGGNGTPGASEGTNSVAFGRESRAEGADSVAIGAKVIASANGQIALGMANLERDDALLVLGNGDANVEGFVWDPVTASYTEARANALVVTNDNRLQLYNKHDSTIPLIVLDPSNQAEPKILVGGSRVLTEQDISALYGGGYGGGSGYYFPPYVSFMTYGVEIGNNAYSANELSVAVGTYSNAWGYMSTAVGNDANANGNGSTAIGASAFAGGRHSLAIGSFSHATADDATALGTGTEANGGQIALGMFNDARPEYAFMIGNGHYTTMGNTPNAEYRSNLFVITREGKGIFRHTDFVEPTVSNPQPTPGGEALRVKGDATVEGTLHIRPSGDLPMGPFTADNGSF